jgi:hypothetical protein
VSAPSQKPEDQVGAISKEEMNLCIRVPASLRKKLGIRVEQEGSTIKKYVIRSLEKSLGEAIPTRKSFIDTADIPRREQDREKIRAFARLLKTKDFQVAGRVFAKIFRAE